MKRRLLVLSIFFVNSFVLCLEENLIKWLNEPDLVSISKYLEGKKLNEVELKEALSLVKKASIKNHLFSGAGLILYTFFAFRVINRASNTVSALARIIKNKRRFPDISFSSLKDLSLKVFQNEYDAIKNGTYSNNLESDIALSLDTSISLVLGFFFLYKTGRNGVKNSNFIKVKKLINKHQNTKD